MSYQLDLAPNIQIHKFLYCFMQMYPMDNFLYTFELYFKQKAQKQPDTFQHMKKYWNQRRFLMGTLWHNSKLMGRHKLRDF
jgi:hypothetical protein